MGSIKGKADMQDLKRLERQLKNMESKKNDEFLRYLTRDLARISLETVIFRTPVISGVLRRGWTGGVEVSPAVYLASKSVTKKGNEYKIILKNDVKYASYVEYGHRQEVGRFIPDLGKRLKKPWVEGQYMCQKTIAQVRARYPSIALRNLDRFLKENLDV